MLKKYKIGFDIWALGLFVIIMIPNCIWFAVPAPNDILRTESVTKIPDMIASISQVIMLIILCVFRNIDYEKQKITHLFIAVMTDVICNLPKGEQIINITEAALIHYFMPEYNVNFVENFPDEHHKGYKQYFDLDYNSLVVELDMEFDNAPIIQFYTKTNRVNSSFDFIRYKLYNEDNRLSMYEIFRNMD